MISLMAKSVNWLLARLEIIESELKIKAYVRKRKREKERERVRVIRIE